MKALATLLLGIACILGVVFLIGFMHFKGDSGFRPMVVASGLENPWSLAFLPDGRMLVTERPGRMRIVTQHGVVQPPLANVPPVFAEGQGGLLDVALDSDFLLNHTLYFSYAEPGKDGTAGTAVARARLGENALEEVKVIFRQQPKTTGPNHWGSRIVASGDGTLFVTLGERYEHRDSAQDISTTLGKVVRIATDGNIPKDNPFAGQKEALPEIWSYGHRNPQGAALHPVTGKLWVHEHGPKGGDEINIIEPGANYGWPVVSLGFNYDGTPVGTGEAHAEGMANPIYSWTPVIAPSGMMFYGGDAFPDWQGDLFVGGLRARALVRLDLHGDKVVAEERLLTEVGRRIRDVAEGPDGAIYVITDEDDGEILRVAPAEGTEG